MWEWIRQILRRIVRGLPRRSRRLKGRRRRRTTARRRRRERRGYQEHRGFLPRVSGRRNLVRQWDELLERRRRQAEIVQELRDELTRRHEDLSDLTFTPERRRNLRVRLKRARDRLRDIDDDITDVRGRLGMR